MRRFASSCHFAVSASSMVRWELFPRSLPRLNALWSELANAERGVEEIDASLCDGAASLVS